MFIKLIFIHFCFFTAHAMKSLPLFLDVCGFSCHTTLPVEEPIFIQFKDGSTPIQISPFNGEYKCPLTKMNFRHIVHLLLHDPVFLCQNTYCVCDKETCERQCFLCPFCKTRITDDHFLEGRLTVVRPFFFKRKLIRID